MGVTPDTPDAVRLVLRDALAEVYAGAYLDDVDALLDQMTDRGLRVAALAECVPRAEFEAALADLNAAYRCEKVVVERDAAVAEVTRLREALEGLAEHDRIAAGVLAAINRSRA